jgi:hypothetical protein
MRGSATNTLNFSEIPILDHHAHSLLIRQPQTPEEYTEFFSETYMQELVQRHVPTSLFFQWGVRALAEFLGCKADLTSVLQARNVLPPADLTKKCVEDANIGTWLIDYGIMPGRLYSHEELKRIAPVRIEPILRIEPLIERLIIESADFDEMLARYHHELSDLRSKGWVSLKSIVAYRTGLQIELIDERAAQEEWVALKAQAARDGKLRIASKPMLDFLVVEACRAAHVQEMPFQFHTGFGDPDLDIYKVNPAFMRPLFGDEFRGCQFVLLHASYPYGRTLAYLAAMYPNIYADLGLAIPWIPGEARQIVRELLALAPASKVMYSSDASRIPELYWLGAKLGRRALADVLREFIADGFISEPQAHKMAELVLWKNAAQLYLR